MRHFFPVPATEHPPARALASGKENRVVSDQFSANPLYFLLAALTEKIKANAVCLWLDELVQAIPQLSVLRWG